MNTGTVREWPYPGSRWWKFDFHSHTPASADYGKGPNQDSLREITPEDWLLGYMRVGVDCVAVTDHNSGELDRPAENSAPDAGREATQRVSAASPVPGSGSDGQRRHSRPRRVRYRQGLIGS